MQARHDERIHLELLHSQLSRYLIVAVHPDGKFTLQPARIDFRYKRYFSVFAVRFEPASEVSLHIRANLEAHKPDVAFRNGRSNRPAAANIEIEAAGNRNGLRLQRADLVERYIRAPEIEIGVLFHRPVQNISGHQALPAAHFAIRYLVYV